MQAETSKRGRILCPLADLDDNAARQAQLDGDHGVEDLILIRRGDDIYCYRNVCPHQGRALNYAPNGFLFTKNDELVCAAHGATFRIDDGVCVGGPCPGASLRGVPVRVEQGNVVVD